MPAINSTSDSDTETSTNNDNMPVPSTLNSYSPLSAGPPQETVVESPHLEENHSGLSKDLYTNQVYDLAADGQCDGEGSETSCNIDDPSRPLGEAQRANTDIEEEFESAEDNSDDDVSYKQPMQQRIYTAATMPDKQVSITTFTRCSVDAIGDGQSSLSSLREQLNESDDASSGESDTSISSSVSPTTEPYKPEIEKDDDSQVRIENSNFFEETQDSSADDRGRRTVSLTPLPKEGSQLSIERISLPSEQRMQRLNEGNKKSSGFAKHFSFPINPFSRSSSTVSSRSTSPQRPSQIFKARVSRLSSDKQKARESITSIVSLKEMLAQNGKSSEEQQHMVMEELEKLKHEIDVEQNEEPNWDFWASVLVDYNKVAKSNFKQLSQHIRLGIPLSLRGMMWQLFSGSKDDALEGKYKDLLSDTSTHEKLILRDLARTFPSHQYFKDRGGAGQEGLFNVVKAYSLYDSEVGYCQGLAFVVGPLLLNMPDEEAFCVLVELMNKYGLRGHFTPQMEQLHRRLYQFEQLLMEKLPRVHRYLHEQGIRSTMYASQWFMTLFAYKFPLDLVFRIFDIILAEGIDSIFQFALAVLQRNEKVILSLEFEALLDFLKNGLFAEYQNDDRRLVQDACAIHINPKKLKRYGRQHDALIAKEQQLNEKEESLRQSNRELMDTIQRLETSLKKLQEEQQDVTAQVITSKVDLARLDSNNSELRRQNSILRRQLEELPTHIEARWKSQFDALCAENADLIQRNSAFEDTLTTQEGVVIALKIRYAECENQKEALQCQFNELKKISSK